MSKHMLIDGTHQEELRVVLMENDKIQNFELETTGKAQIKGNVYVAEISRVEPSLQAAFITYGGNRNGFLAFGELHPSFFDVPKAEKDGLLKELEEIAERRRNRNAPEEADEDAAHKAAALAEEDSNEATSKEQLSQQEMDEDARALAIANGLNLPDDEKPKIRRAGRNKKQENEPEQKEERKPPIHRRYKIEDVLKEGQKILVQVVKEERGNKGAALTTYFTLPGRYTVLMPNTPYAGGISRKISDSKDRKALKEVFDDLNVPLDMGLIIRTAGVGQDSKSIKKDFKNLTTLWSNIQKSFKKKDGGIRCLHEDGSVIIRALRDMAKDDVTEVIIEGKRSYEQAKSYAKSLMPEVAKIIKEHKHETPLFVKNGIEQQLTELHHTRIELPSGGYLVIHPTEALVSVDVNSGRATQERNIEETALKTNLEAATELARQMRLRDLAGLIVVDFIDMEETRNARAIERAMRKEIRKDRARLQVGNISDFGLMEISRQRLRPSFVESHYTQCPNCNGTGQVHTLASSALLVLRRLEEEDAQEADRLVVTTSSDLIIYMLNHKRELIRDMEAKYKYQILFRTDNKHIAPDFRLDIVRVKSDGSENSQTQEIVLREQAEQPPELRYRRQNRKGRNKKNDNDKETTNRRRRTRRNTKEADAENSSTTENNTSKKEASTEEKPKNRGRRSKKQVEPKTTEVEKSTKKEGSAPEKEQTKKPQRRTAKKSEDDKKIKKEPVATTKEQAPKIVEDKPLQVETIGADGKTESKPQQKNPATTFQRWWSKA
ncbi:MAG: Rne/Rng family ribonuclease [Alphaproteobacteria bacterium]|nr:Rne/Rng family ribonuclease [Alphaproteobacteria bacterium]MDD9919903.1 Rne/Rng family ribonuclease [Alphaproteobacteria bacterium]